MHTRYWLLVAFLVVGMPSVGTAQSRADSVLIGVREVDAQVSIDWDEKIITTTKAEFESKVEFRFQFELRKLGLIVTPKAPNILYCRIYVMAGDGTIRGIVSYSLAIELYEFLLLPRRQSSFWVATWDKATIGTIGMGKLRDDAESFGKDCAESFGNAWLAANPKR